MSESILVVDDEQEVADLLELYLVNEGYQVRKFYQGKGAEECVAHEKIDLALLDVMLPDMDGFQLCRKIREKHFFPIIMLTAKVEDVDKIHGLMLGADDYITKPFNPLEVIARVKTQLRRYHRYNEKGGGAAQAEQENHIWVLYLVWDRRHISLASLDLRQQGRVCGCYVPGRAVWDWGFLLD